MSIVDLAKTIGPKCELQFVGIRPGEKLHEEMIGMEDSINTYEYPGYYKILPLLYDWHESTKRIKNGVRVSEGFVYSSDKNSEWMSSDELFEWLETYRAK